MTPQQLVKAECANFTDAFCIANRKPCRVLDGDRCAYFENCLMPLDSKASPEDEPKLQQRRAEAVAQYCEERNCRPERGSLVMRVMSANQQGSRCSRCDHEVPGVLPDSEACMCWRCVMELSWTHRKNDLSSMVGRAKCEVCGVAVPKRHRYCPTHLKERRKEAYRDEKRRQRQKSSTCPTI